MRVAVIDLGFNSLKLVSYEVKQDNSFVAFDQESVPARLGEGLTQTGFLGNEQIGRTIDGLKFFKEINELYSVRHCLPIATSAVREAANKNQFLHEAFRETGYKLRVLSGNEEALFSYTGAVSSISESNILFFDLGGGSVELVSAEGPKIKKILSLPLGGLRLTQLYADSNGVFKGKAFARLENRIWDLLPDRNEVLLKKETILVGVGGNLRALARWDQKLRNYPFNKIHNYTIKRTAIGYMRKELMQLTTNEIGQIDVIGRTRAETVAAGSFVIDLIMRKLEFQKVVVSTHGLRDGVLVAFLKDPVAYHNDRMGKGGGRLSLKKSKTGRSGGKNYDALPGPRALIRTLQSFDLIIEKEVEMLDHSLRWALDDNLSVCRPESFFYQMMDEDTNLTHREQLVASLSVVQLRKQRSAQWFYERFRTMLKPKNEHEFEKLASILRILEILARSGSRVRVSLAERGSKIKLNVIPGKSDLPLLLFRDSVAILGEKLDRYIDYSVKKPTQYQAKSIISVRQTTEQGAAAT